MGRVRVYNVFLLLAFFITGCSSMEGLQVLTGQANQQTIADQSVAALDLVMADKTGATDPSLIAAADRIEAAAGTVDIIEEFRNDRENRIFDVEMLFRPPTTDNSLEGQVAQLDALRRAIELTWQGTMLESEGTDVIRVVLMDPANIVTLDNGLSFVGIVWADTQIERAAAASYLAGTRSLAGFYDLIAVGTLSYERPTQIQLYEGQPNHPLFMLPSGT